MCRDDAKGSVRVIPEEYIADHEWFLLDDEEPYTFRCDKCEMIAELLYTMNNVLDSVEFSFLEEGVDGIVRIIPESFYSCSEVLMRQALE